MTKDEARAVTFLGVLLCLALAARYINRPGPVTITAGAVDLEAFREAGRSLRQKPQPGSPARAARATETVEARPERWTVPAWQRNAGSSDYRTGNTKDAGRIDINRATAAELESLPGIGPATARRIVARRDSIGRYEKLADLDAVKGIGPALLKKIEPHVMIR